MDKKRVLKPKESSSETEESEIGSEEEIKKSRIRSSTEDDGEMKQSEIEFLKKSEATIKKETTEDPEEDPDVDDESEVNLKTEENSSDMVKIENDADTDACFSSDEEDHKSLEEEKSQNSEIKKEQNTSTESFEPKQENHDPKSSSDEDEPVKKQKRDVDESSDEDIPKKNPKKRKFEVSSSDEDQPVKRKNSSKKRVQKKVSKFRDRRKALESSDDEEFADDDDTFEEVELKPPPKTFLIEESKSEEISKIFEKIRRKWKNIGKIDKLLYLRFKIQKPLDLPNDQQYRKLIKLPNKLHHNPRCCIILKDDPEEWLKLKEEFENESVWKALGQFQIIQLKEYRKRTKGAIKRRKFLKDFDLLIADNRIRKTKLMRTNFGREAYKDKKIPFSVKIGTKLQSQIEDVYCKTQIILGDNKTEFDAVFGRSEDKTEVLMKNLQCLIDNLDTTVPYGFPNISKMLIRALSVPSCSFYEYDPSDTIWNDGNESSRFDRPLVERTRGMSYKDHKEDELEQRKTRKRMKLKRKRQMESSKRFGGLFAKRRKMMAG